MKPITKKPLLTIIMALLGCAVVMVEAADKPNVLIIMADDCTYNDLPLYGGKNAKTPNIDRLASQGLTFNRAYVAEAMCQPCRSELFTGLYPMRNGCAWNHSASRPGVKSLPQHLGALGYRVGLAGKVHVTPESVYPFEKVAGFDKNCVRDPTRDHDLAGISEFMTCGEEDELFCLVVGLVEPHVPWVMGDRSQYPPRTLQLPPNMADTPRTREDFAAYLAEITYMDGQVGEILQTLESSGAAEDTLVLFTSEQGSQFPGNKWTNWDTGLHTALVARWPGKVPAGKRSDALVQYADVVPTLLEAAGGSAQDGGLDGVSFLPVLLGESAASPRRYAYGVHNNIPEGPSYPIRTITNGTHRFIRNLSPERIYIEKHLMGWTGTGKLNNPYWATWVREAWTNEHTYSVVERYMHRPAEELYHTAEDAYEMRNLADEPELASLREELANALDQWLEEQGDPGIPQDTHRAHQAAKKGRHLFGPKP